MEGGVCMASKNQVLSRRELLQAASRLGLSGAALAAVRAAPAGERDVPARAMAEKGGSARGRSPLILGYYPDWKPLEATRLDMTAFTHICQAFARLDPDGSLHFPDEVKTRTLIETAHKKKTRVLLSVGGAGSGARLRDQQTDP